MVWIQKVHLLAKIFLIVVLFSTVYIHLSIETYFVLSCLATLSVIPFCVKKICKEIPYINYLPRIDWPIFREMLPYSLNIFSFSLFQFSFYNLRPVFLGIQGTIESVADYRILNGIIGVVTMMSGAFLGALLPSTSRVVAQHNKEAYYKIAYAGTRYVSIVVCFFCFLLMAVGTDLITLYVGVEYLYLIPWFNIWLICTLGTHNQAISSLILAGTDIRAISYSSVFASVIGLITAWFTIPIYQIGGTVIGFIAYMLVQLSFYYFYYWPCKMAINSFNVFFRQFLPYVLIGIICTISIGMFHCYSNIWYNLIFKGISFSFFYLLLVLLSLNHDDRRLLINTALRKHKI